MYVATGTSAVRARRPAPTFTSTVEAAGAKAFAVLSCAYVVGTMGALTPELMAQKMATSSWVQYKYPGIEALATTGRNAVALQPTPAADLARVREVLKPAVLELAGLFGVSRQTVYDWQAGAQPSAQASTRLAELARAADVFALAGVTVNAQTLRRKVAGGGTLLDAVLNGGDAVQVAQSLVDTLRREASQRQLISQQLAGRKRSPANPADYGAPGLADEA